MDLLWFGGIGTYVKASSERHGDAGDRANDGLRVDANTLRAKVIGEGANLAMTQRARIEYALNGGRLNTDAVDNSAGVDTSDHEVNIKIGVRRLLEAGRIAEVDRPSFLASLTDEVEALVLKHNYLQTLGLTLAEARAPILLDRQARLMRSLERQGRLNREVEFLPDDETIRQRGAAKRGLTRPELAVLMAYAKNVLNDELQASDLPDAPELKAELLAYFPARMRVVAPDVLDGHRLRREILATVIANDVINRMGATFIDTVQTRTGRDSVAIARAFLITREVFDLPAVWREIDELDNKVPAATQTRLLLAMRLIVDQAVRWFLLSGRSLGIGALTAEFRPGVRDLAGHVAELLPQVERDLNLERRAAYIADGAPPALAERIVVLNTLSTAMDIVQLSQRERPRHRGGGPALLRRGYVLRPADAPPPSARYAGRNPVAVARGRRADRRFLCPTTRDRAATAVREERRRSPRRLGGPARRAGVASAGHSDRCRADLAAGSRHADRGKPPDPRCRAIADFGRRFVFAEG